MSSADDGDRGVTTGTDEIDVERKRLADRLAATRALIGLSQSEVAEATKLTRLVISSIETGRRKVESVELAALARLYGQPVSYFLPDATPKYGSAPDGSDGDVAFIARAAKELKSEDRAELLRFAEFLRAYRAPEKSGTGTDASDEEAEGSNT